LLYTTEKLSYASLSYSRKRHWLLGLYNACTETAVRDSHYERIHLLAWFLLP